MSSEPHPTTFAESVEPPVEAADGDVSTTPEKPDWRPRDTARDNSDPKRCQHCGAHVTPGFRRVFAGRDGLVHACPACCTTSDLSARAAGKEPRIPGPTELEGLK